MPKYRKLPVTVIDSLDVAEMPDDFTRLTWLLLPLVVCREGRAFDLPQWLMSKLYPARTDVDADMVAAALDWFAGRDMIRRYTVNGRAYFYMTNWTKHQGDTRKEAESPYPAPGDAIDCASPELVQSYSGPTPELVQSNSAPMQSKSKSKSKSSSNAVASSNGASAEDVAAAAAAYLRQFGLSYNAKTAPIARLPEDYIRGHVAYAQQHGDKPGLAITRMLDGDPIPGQRASPDLARQIPADLADIIQR